MGDVQMGVRDFEVLRSQDGVITSAQARMCGLSQSAVDRRIRSDRWRRVGRGIYVACDRDFTDSARVHAAVLGAGDNAVLSAAAAAWWHGLVNDLPAEIEVTVPRNRRPRPYPGTRYRRRDLARQDVTHRAGVDLTALALTAVEAATECGFEVLDTALARRTTLRALEAAHRRNLGRTGSRRAGLMLEAMGSGARSNAERRFVAILRKARITGWTANFRVAGAVIDVAFREAMVAIEIDGFAFHSGQRSFVHDRRRQNMLVAAGWTVLRFTWQDLIDDEAGVIDRVRAAIGDPKRR